MSHTTLPLPHWANLATLATLIVISLLAGG